MRRSTDAIVDVPEGFRDARPGRVAGQLHDGPQGEPRTGQAGGERAVPSLLGRGPGTGRAFGPDPGDVPDDGEGELARRGLYGGAADLDRERDPVFARPGQPCPCSGWPGRGNGRLREGGPVAKRLPGTGRDEGVEPAPRQFLVPVAEHLLKPPAGQHQYPVAVRQCHPVIQDVQQPPQHCRGDGRAVVPVRRPWHDGGRRGRLRGGHGRLQRRVDRDQVVEPAEAERAPDDPVGNH